MDKTGYQLIGEACSASKPVAVDVGAKCDPPIVSADTLVLTPTDAAATAALANGAGVGAMTIPAAMAAVALIGAKPTGRQLIAEAVQKGM